MRILWEPPEEPGPEVTAVSINDHIYIRYPKQGTDTADWWRRESYHDGETWLDLVSDAAWASVAILDATP
jgi:hypothetical protein